MSRGTVYRVAGQVQRLVRRFGPCLHMLADRIGDTQHRCHDEYGQH